MAAAKPPQPISLDYRELNKLIYAGHFLTTIFEIDVGGRKERVIPRDYQLDVVKDTPLHVDFLRLKAARASRRRSRALHQPGHLPRHQAGRHAQRRAPHDRDAASPPTTSRRRSRRPDGPRLQRFAHISAVKLPEGCTPTIRDRDFTVATIAPPTRQAEETRRGCRCRPGRRLPRRRAPAAGAKAPAGEGAAPRRQKEVRRNAAPRALDGGGGSPVAAALSDACMLLFVGLGNPGRELRGQSSTTSASWPWTPSRASTRFRAVPQPLSRARPPKGQLAGERVVLLEARRPT